MACWLNCCNIVWWVGGPSPADHHIFIIFVIFYTIYNIYSSNLPESLGYLFAYSYNHMDIYHNSCVNFEMLLYGYITI